MILLINSNIEFNWTGQSILWIQSISVMEVCNVVILRQDRAGAGRAVSVSVCVHPSVSDSHLVPAAATRALCSNKTACQLSRRRSLVIPMPLSSELLCLADCVFIVYYSSASAKQITSELSLERDYVKCLSHMPADAELIFRSFRQQISSSSSSLLSWSSIFNILLKWLQLNDPGDSRPRSASSNWFC